MPSVPYERLVVHHSASPRISTKLESIRAWHKERKFYDVGYNYVIEGEGQTLVGRPIPQIPAANGRGFNSGTIAVCLVGDNTDKNSINHWVPSQWIALAQLVRAVRMLIPGIEVIGHRDLKETACPGVDIAPIFRKRR